MSSGISTRSGSDDLECDFVEGCECLVGDLLCPVVDRDGEQVFPIVDVPSLGHPQGCLVAVLHSVTGLCAELAGAYIGPPRPWDLPRETTCSVLNSPRARAWFLGFER